LTGATTASSAATGINNLGTFNFNAGVTTVTYTVRDAAGNTSSCSYTVTVSEIIPPTINCLSDITVNASSTSCNANVTIPQYINALTQSTCLVPSPPICGTGTGPLVNGTNITAGQTYWYSSSGTFTSDTYFVTPSASL
jgi:hypothetical protein